MRARWALLALPLASACGLGLYDEEFAILSCAAFEYVVTE